MQPASMYYWPLRGSETLLPHFGAPINTAFTKYMSTHPANIFSSSCCSFSTDALSVCSLQGWTFLSFSQPGVSSFVARFPIQLIFTTPD